uniref:Uncharacterized protein n=1 Tax=Attheya septentrionalis TaxID=420275 RepID=A0A7S2UHS8_9STRA|mmetsp:Transcript_23130/g.41777  ORF Transcript_23130/g.41777 Transcript_23130/m.41777 type:complete len:442 (+) Transcript_23130:178-1503(+)
MVQFSTLAFVGWSHATGVSRLESTSPSWHIPFQQSTSKVLPMGSLQLQPVVHHVDMQGTDVAPLLKNYEEFQLSSNNHPGFVAISRGVREWLVPVAEAAENVKPPTDAEIKLLQSGLGALYGERNPAKAEPILSEAIVAWERQPPDEKAALYRVRGDCQMELARAEEAVKDYTITIDLLDGPGGELADPAEKPAARLGRGRALRSLGRLSKEQSAQAAKDYQIALRLTSREEWDTNAENEEDGAARNPYAAWEWGMARRGAGDYNGAAQTHALAGIAFADIGDKPRSVISNLDAGIDLAASGNIDEAKSVLESAIKSTTAVEGRDVQLLQRIISKEGEARIALASILWGSNDKLGAERQLGEASARLDQLDADAVARELARVKSGAMPPPNIQKLKFSIDDVVGAGEISFSRFKNEKFLSESLQWPDVLQEKVGNLQKLGK